MSLDFSPGSHDAPPPCSPVPRGAERTRSGGTEADLLAQWVGSRDERSLAMLMAAHRPMVAAVCRRILGHRLDAEEVTDEVFADLAHEAAAIHGPPGAWLRRVATHRAWRRNRRCKVVSVALRGDEVALPADRGAGGGEEDGDRLRHCLATALTSLSDAERHVVVHHFYRNRSPAEIAGAVGISAHAIRKRLGAALERLSRQEAIRRLYAELS